MTTGRLGQQAAPPNAAYAGQVVHFPDPVRASRHPRGVRVDENGCPVFAPYARAAAEIAEPPQGFGVDELRLTDYVSANAALAASGHELWDTIPAVATPHGWTWHHVPGGRRMELVPVEVKALLRHHGGLASTPVDQNKRGTRPLQETRPAHFRLPKGAVAVSEQQVQGVEEDLGYRLPGAYRSFLKAAGGSAPAGAALDAELGLLVDQPFFTVREEAAVNDLVYVNKCLRDHLTKDYLGVGFVQGGILAVKVRGNGTGSVWFCAYDDARDQDGWNVQERVDRLLLPCGADFDAFLQRLAGNPPELETVANLMVDGGFARAVPVEGVSAMVTFAQAQERADEWVNGDVPGYQHREVRVREFELGFVVWAEDRAEGPVSDGGRQRMVIARDSGEATLWPGLPVGEVIRRYEEEYGAVGVAPAAPGSPERIDLNQTSFLLSPPEWLQEAADKLGIPDRRAERGAAPAPAASGPGGQTDHEPTAPDGVPASVPNPASGDTPWAGTDTNAGSDDGAVALPATVFAPPLSGSDDGTPPSTVGADAPTALMSGGSRLPRTAIVAGLNPQGPGAPGPGGHAPGHPGGPGVPGPGPVGAPGRSGDGDIADAATSKAAVPPRGARGGGAAPPPPPPPGVPGVPGAGPGAPVAPSSGPGAPGAPAGGYLPTQLVSQAGPSGAPHPAPPGPPVPPGPMPPSDGGFDHAATMLAEPGPSGPRPPGPPGVPGVPGVQQPPAPPGPPGRPGATPPPVGGVHHAATMFAEPGPGGPRPPGPPGPPGAPGMPAGGAPGPVPPNPHTPPPPAYGYPQAPAGQPTVGPGYQAVLRFRAPDGSEQQLIRRSAPGTPHPEWQMLHELRAMNVPPQQVIELHTELESCELPGGYCARMIRETWPQVRITSVAPYGTDHASRQQGMQHLLTHQGELHQVADGPARPAPVRAPLPQMPPAMPIPPEGIAEELLQVFGPQGVLRFDQRAVSRQGVPEIVARTLVWAGLPADFGPFFWAQPGQPVVPTLAELAVQRQVQPASDAGSYLVMGSDFGKAICVQYGTANIVAVPVEAGPGGQPVPPQFVNTGLPEFARSMALLGRMWRLRFGLNPEQAGRWTVDFQAQLVALDPAALASPESWWSVLLEQMWDGLI